MNTYTIRPEVTDSYGARTDTDYLMTQDLDFLMTQDGNYIVLQSSYSDFANYIVRQIVTSSYTERPTI